MDAFTEIHSRISAGQFAKTQILGIGGSPGKGGNSDSTSLPVHGRGFHHAGRPPAMDPAVSKFH